MRVPKTSPSIPIFEAAPLFRTEGGQKEGRRFKRQVTAAFLGLDKPLRDFLRDEKTLKGIIVGTDFRRGLLPADSPVRSQLPISITRDTFGSPDSIVPRHYALPGAPGIQPSEMYILMPKQCHVGSDSYKLTRRSIPLYFEEEVGHVLDYLLARKGTHIARENAISNSPSFRRARETDIEAIRNGIANRTFGGAQLTLLAIPLGSAEETFAKVFASLSRRVRPWTSLEERTFTQQYQPVGQTPNWEALVAAGQDIQVGQLRRLKAGVPQAASVSGELGVTHFKAVASYFPATRRFVQNLLRERGLLQQEPSVSGAVPKSQSTRPGRRRRRWG